jgi:type IV pilus assembly protein PilM
MSVPGYDGLARFAKLPPIPKKAIPQTVLFEANQQIPFPLEEVEWDYHVFSSADSLEHEVGIFAILKEKIAQRIGLYKELGIRPSGLTLGPVAVYNAMMFDRRLDGPDQPVLAFLDIGTRATDLVVIQDGRCWIRTFPIGGHSFTEAISSAFRMPYGKADRSKVDAATHQYGKQLLKSMTPVFEDLVQEVRRSLGHHQSLNPGKPITQIIGLGSTFRITGLRAHLQSQLQVEVRRFQDFERIKVEGSAASEFSGSAINLATAVGLALQGLGQSAISVNLSPVGSLREQVWRRKTKWFVAAALIMCAGAGALFIPVGGNVGETAPGQVKTVITEAKGHLDALKEAEASASVGERANNVMFMLEDREIWPWVIDDANAAVASTGGQQELQGDFDPASPPVPYEQWKVAELMDLRGKYKLVAGATPKRTIEVTMQVLVPRDEKGAKEFVQGTVLDWLNKNAKRDSAPYEIVIPPKGIVPQFAALGAKPDSGSSGSTSRSGGQAEEEQEEEAPVQTKDGAGAFSGRNKADGGITRKRASLGGSGGFSETVPEDELAGEGGGSGGASSGSGRKDRRVDRVAVKSTAAEPVDLARDAPIPAAPQPFAGRSATVATIKFTLELKKPEGRELSPPAGGESSGEGEQQ